MFLTPYQPPSFVTPSPSARRVSNDSLEPSPLSHRYMIVNLEKTNKSVPWGLSICWISDAVLVFQHATSNNTVVRGYWDTYSNVQPDYLGRHPTALSSLLESPPFKSSSIHTVAPISILKSGDIILCLGGRPISEFADLSQVATYLRLHHALQIVVHRPNHRPPTSVMPPRQLFVTPPPPPPPKPKPVYRNNLFKDPETGEPLRYDDDDFDEPEDGFRLVHFVRPIPDFQSWLKDRKKSWGRNVLDDSERVQVVEFWKPEFSSHAEWLHARTSVWKTQYSWNKEKKQSIAQSCEKIVHVIESDFDDWLKTRKHQWKVLRRKRHRETTTVVNPELLAIDELIQEQEQACKKSKREDQPPLDIAFLFDTDLGCPDDVVAKILNYLVPHELPKLLEVNSALRRKIIQREQLFRLLCPSHWTLPRRPRKPWYLIYLTQLKVETEQSRKLWDDLLARASSILLSGDCIQSIEKLVTEAEQSCRFNVNYISSVVCERNSILNLAVIHRRFKVVRWLVEAKAADIESYDRGGFTALLNAAYNGDKAMVRFFLSKGADRSKIGLFHYTRPLSAQTFKGHTAEGWAASRGFNNVAKLIRYGL